VLEARDDLSSIIAAENGKPMVGALGDVDYAAGFVDWFAILVYSVARPAGISSVVTIWVL